MSEFLFEHFLEDEHEYSRLREFWIAQLKAITPKKKWHGYQPYAAEAFADGTPFNDGNPVITAVNWATSHALRVVQENPREFGNHYSTNVSTLPLQNRYTRHMQKVQEKVIVLTLTRENLHRALYESAEWLYGAAHARRLRFDKLNE